MESAKSVSVSEFLSVSINLAEQCGKVIRSVYDSGDLSTKLKDGGDGPVTVADFQVQKTIETNLKTLFPEIQIRGEEEKALTDKYESAFGAETLSKTILSQDFLNKSQASRKEFLGLLKKTSYPNEDEFEVEANFENFKLEDATVWVDPLDGTSDFVKNNLPAVTVLIGVSIKNVSRIGIVHNPFSLADQTQGVTYFGTIEHGVFHMSFDPKTNVRGEPVYIEPFDHVGVPAEDHKVAVAASISHFSDEMKQSNFQFYFSYANACSY